MDIVMRYEMEKMAGEELRFLAIKTRDYLNLTQKEMGKRLQMSESSYSDIETGRTICGMLTTILLLDMQDNPQEFLYRVREKFALWYEKEMQTV